MAMAKMDLFLWLQYLTIIYLNMSKHHFIPNRNKPLLLLLLFFFITHVEPGVFVFQCTQLKNTVPCTTGNFWTFKLEFCVQWKAPYIDAG